MQPSNAGGWSVKGRKMDETQVDKLGSKMRNVCTDVASEAPVFEANRGGCASTAPNRSINGYTIAMSGPGRACPIALDAAVNVQKHSAYKAISGPDFQVVLSDRGEVACQTWTNGGSMANHTAAIGKPRR